MNSPTRTIYLALGIVVCIGAQQASGDDAVSGRMKVRSQLEKRPAAVGGANTDRQARIEQLNLPEDTSARFTVREVHIGGNTLISTDELLSNMPQVYNASDKPIHQAEAGDLYDFRALHDIISHPGQPREVSRRTMQGFTEYILSVYQEHNYAGIYVYIASKVVQGRVELQDEILPIEIVEAKVSEISVTAYDIEREEVEKGILRSSVVQAWSPVKVGQVVNKKKLDDFVNLLNENPDRYVSAVISRGSEPNTLALGYDVYEAEPWHFYIQVDNSGIEERQWAPRVGIINTNLTGMDDRFAAVYQAPWESGIEENYLLFGSYGFPVFTPRLRLNLYAGLSEFDVGDGLGIDFLGRGSFYGSILSYNLFQMGGWYVDIIGSLSHEKSKVTPTLGIASDVDMDLWGVGLDLHRSDDMSNTSLTFNRVASMGASSKSKFQKARLDTDPYFTIYNFSAAHGQYLDPNRIHRLTGSVRLITSDERLAPSKMTTFGGLYSVRGYEEEKVVADGGILVSAQYEFDLVKHIAGAENGGGKSEEAQDKGPRLRKLAPLGFVDYGRAKIKDSVAGEKEVEELCSLGLGAIVELGDKFSAAMYYGWPLRPTDDTDEGHGRFNFSFVYRF